MIEEIIFTEIDGKIYPSKQFINSFFVAERVFFNQVVELRGLTLSNLIIVLIRNQSKIIYYNFIRLLYKLGFIEIEENCSFSWKKNFRIIPKRSRYKGAR